MALRWPLGQQRLGGGAIGSEGLGRQGVWGRGSQRITGQGDGGCWILAAAVDFLCFETIYGNLRDFWCGADLTDVYNILQYHLMISLVWYDHTFLLLRAILVPMAVCCGTVSFCPRYRGDPSDQYHPVSQHQRLSASIIHSHPGRFACFYWSISFFQTCSDHFFRFKGTFFWLTIFAG